MTILPNNIFARSEEFRLNRENALASLARVRDLEGRIAQLSGREGPRFRKAGKLLPRERVDLLLDPGAPLIALTPLSGLGLHEDDGDEQVLGGGVIAGIGFVSGTRVVVIVNDSGVKGGTTTWAGTQKVLRAQQIALEQKLPLINLVESGGGNLRLAHLTFAVHGGQRFAGQARLSAAGIPQVSVVHGNATAGGAYIPGLSDYVIAVRGQTKMFLAGPPLLKMATGEIANDEELGGAQLHAQEAGTAEWIVDNDREAIACARDVVRSLRWPSHTESNGQGEIRPPLYDIEELLGIVSADYRNPFDVRDVIARIVDGSEFFEFKAAFDPYTVCGRGAVDGYACGLIGNNGPITAKGAVKAAQFIQLCDQTATPLIFLQNTTGFIVGRAAEAEGIIKHGSKLIQAVANVRVPRITMMIGASFGAGNFAMCGRGLAPDFLFTWPNHRICIMGAEQAAGVLDIVARAGSARRSRPVDEDLLARQHQEIVDLYGRVSSALYATAHVWDDGIIDPRDTRRVLAECLAITNGARHRSVNPNAFGVARL